MKRIYPIAIIIIVLAISSVLFLTQYKSYHIIKEQTFPNGGSQTMDIQFKIEKAEKPWKFQLNIIAEYGDVMVSLLTEQDEFLWFENLYEGIYEYEFIHTEELKFRIRIPSYTDAQEVELKILAWKSFLGW
jgi:hypothetical protein